MRNKVALFVPSLRGGGAERVMVNLARGFTDQGLEVDLVLAKAEGPYLSKVPPEVRVVDLGVKRVLYSLPCLVDYLRRKQPKALFSAMSHANIIALWAKRLARTRTKVVVSEHSTLSRSASNSPNMRGRFMPMFIKRFYPWADAIVAVSKGVADDLASTLGLPREKIRVIYNPIVTPELLDKAKEPVDHPWFQPGEPPVILSVGRLTKVKDFPTLLRAFALVRKKLMAHLVILGEGEERSKLEALARELGIPQDVDMPGFTENPYKYMAHAAVFVLSSAWEGLPTVLVEALAIGTPVVSTDCKSGPREILRNGQFGQLVPVGDVYGLAKGIVIALNQPKRLMPTTVWRPFSLGTSVKQYLQVLEGIDESRTKIKNKAVYKNI